MSSSQNERTLGVGEGVLENEQKRTRWARSKLGSIERTYFLNVPQCNVILHCITSCILEHFYLQCSAVCYGLHLVMLQVTNAVSLFKFQ